MLGPRESSTDSETGKLLPKVASSAGRSSEGGAISTAGDNTSGRPSFILRPSDAGYNPIFDPNRAAAFILAILVTGVVSAVKIGVDPLCYMTYCRLKGMKHPDERVEGFEHISQLASGLAGALVAVAIWGNVIYKGKYPVLHTEGCHDDFEGSEERRHKNQQVQSKANWFYGAIFASITVAPVIGVALNEAYSQGHHIPRQDFLISTAMEFVLVGGIVRVLHSCGAMPHIEKFLYNSHIWLTTAIQNHSFAKANEALSQQSAMYEALARASQLDQGARGDPSGADVEAGQGREEDDMLKGLISDKQSSFFDRWLPCLRGAYQPVLQTSSGSP
jgi:hypothetical protein